MEPFNQALVTNPRTYDTSTGNVLLEAANNLSDVGDAATSRSNLGLGTIATQDANSVTITGGSVTGITDLAIADGGTGAGTAAGARTNLEVYSTSEVDEYLAPKATAGGVRLDGVAGVGRFDTSLGHVADQTKHYHARVDFYTAKQQVLFSSWGGGADSRGWFIRVEANGSILFNYRHATLNSSGPLYTLPAGTIAENKSTLIDFTLNINSATGALTESKILIDGVEKTWAVSGSSVPYADALTTPFVVGARSVNITATAFDGFTTAEVSYFAIFNRALTAAEVETLYRNGLAGIADADRWGGVVAVQDTSSGTGFFGSINGTRTGNIDSIGGVNDTLRFYPDASNAIHGSPATTNVYFAGISYRIKFDIYIPSGNSNVTGIALDYRGGSITHDNLTVDTWHTIEETVTPTTSGAFTIFQVASGSLTFVGANSVTDDLMYIANLSLTRLGAIAAYPMDEGIGYQLHDISSNHYDGLLSASGFTHLLPKTEGKVRVKAADASSAMYMLRAGDIIPTNSIVDNVLSEQCFVDLTNSAQTLDDNRIRLNPSGSDLQIQRSDGSNHQTLGTVTAPSSLSDVDVEVQYKQVIR